MRLLIVTQYFWPEVFVVNGLATELEKKGHDVSVLTGLPNYPGGSILKEYSFWRGPWKETYHNVKLFRIPIFPRGFGLIRRCLNYLSFVLSGFIFSFFHPVFKNDVIFCYMISPITSCLPALLIRALTGKKLVLWVQDLWPETVEAVGAVKSKFLLSLLGSLVRFIYKRCDKIMVSSEAFTTSVVKWGGLPEKIVYVPNWAEPFPVLTNSPPWVSALPPGFLISFAGNLGQAQDLKTLVEAAVLVKEDPDIKWIIAGEGSEKAWLEQEIIRRDLQGKILTVGKKPYSDMLQFFEKSDVLLVSLKNEPNFALTVPSKVQAYMLAGRPIIASLAGEGARIIHQAQAGLTCEPENPEQLAATVLKMKNLKLEQRQALGHQGQKFARRYFNRDAIIDQIEGVFNSLIKS